MHGARKQAAAGERGLRTLKLLCGSAGRQPRVILPQKREKLLRATVYAERSEVSLLSAALDKRNYPVGELHLSGYVSADVEHILKPPPRYVGEVLGQHLRSLSRVNRRKRLPRRLNGVKLPREGRIDHLLIYPCLQHPRRLLVS